VADEVDIANDLVEARTANMIARIRNRKQAKSLPNCVECNEAICATRQALGGITRCVECQTLAETLAGRYA
jgi:phage/conjugal plasmid C-4 type zinc finger TraR family protein